ncbi:maltose phosphorylase [Carnobacterium iners]|uniref:Maltose phosphorylase n=1 Tax=Carnobacterium iners TaxID=1073423 RepID=A0A1X7N4D0_9LACT|nr:glycoside hydrolase family 65 protein [Carnobacterium iners]SEK61152.1 maltose phosphorylase [Carnobacterium iners]SMH32199.1 maltose phosphorylase [Carnobacterium iners]
MKRLFELDEWKVQTHMLEKKDRRLQESLMSIGNGYMGMRGNFEETYSGDHHQGSYLAGVWYPDKTRVGWWKNGYPEYFGKVINSMNFIKLDIYIDGERVDLYEDSISEFELSLDMQKGILSRSYIAEKLGSRIHVEVERFVSLAQKELCAIRMKVTSLTGEVTIGFAPALDGNVVNEDSNYEEKFWLPISITENSLTVETKPNDFEIEQFTVAAKMLNRVENVEYVRSSTTDMSVVQEYSGKLKANESATIEKLITLTTSRDSLKEEVTKKSMQISESVAAFSFEQLRQQQVSLWQERWDKADVIIGGDRAAQQGIRYNLFQLFSTYYGEDDRLNIGPKGFTGEKYGGATYWDTEAYAIPLYLALTDQKVSKNLLNYRHNQLPQAEHNARQQGLKGALYPMVTFTGVECHNEWEITFEEIHRNGAMAYAIYNYTNYTGDESYLMDKGLDVLVGISRFWADRVHYNQDKDQYMMHGVTGPNEYENNVNNNWYTNKIAIWTLNYTLASLEKAENKKRTLNIRKEESKKWQAIIDKMYFPYDEKREIFVQHDTFLDKELRPVSELDPAELPLSQNWSWDKILRSPYIKQADVLQGIYFFKEEFTAAEKQRNFDFYEPLTVHESSLSPSIHAILAADLQKVAKAVELYSQTARLDLDNYNNDTEDGLHITSMTGSWLTIVEGFAGMRTAGGKLSFAPLLPDNWTNYEFHINYRERLLKMTIDNTINGLTVTLVKGSPIELTLYEEQILLKDEYNGSLKK